MGLLPIVWFDVTDDLPIVWFDVTDDRPRGAGDRASFEDSRTFLHLNEIMDGP